MSKKVFIVNPTPDYEKMFISMGWGIVHSLKDADIIQFTGGSDVSPLLYGETKHPSTNCNVERDEREELIIHLAMDKLMPITGICRGAQFVNVMCGGKLWQNVNGHAIAGTHQAWDTRTDEYFPVTSTHHQMMISSGKNAQIILLAQESTKKERVGNTGNVISIFDQHVTDVEAIWYPTYLCFCFQPHPELSYIPSLKVKYFEYLDEFLMSKYGA